MKYIIHFIYNGVALIVIFSTIACTKKNTPPLSDKDKQSSSRIDKQNTFFRNLGAEPGNLHPIRSTDIYASTIQGYVLDTLLMRHHDTYKLEPYLAE